MRKYDSKNKRNITIVITICLIILIVFALFIKRVSDLDKKEYNIETNSVVYDADKNMITLESDGVIKIKWSEAYYLKYNDTETALDKQAVVYNAASKTINLYGTIYKINADESVEALKDESIVDDTVTPKFYKLADRKYLLLGNQIKNQSGDFTANDYLIVELDKLGNAVLYNNKINMKTLSPVKLETTAYTFDIANEIINFGNDDIDLKKIIGSTNLYKPEPEESIESTTESTGDGTGSGEGSGTGEGEGDSTTSDEEQTSGGVSSITDNRLYQDKNFSIVKKTIGTNYVSIDYSIYDPKSEYKNVFVEIENDTTKEVETYYLAKNGTNIKISRLVPNTKYNLTYKYSYLDTDLNVLYNSFNILDSITTILPETTIEVSKLTNNTVYYTLSESDKLMYKAHVELYINDERKTSYDFSSDSATNTFYGTFDLTEYEKIEYITLKCTSLTYSSGTVSANIITKVKN